MNRFLKAMAWIWLGSRLAALAVGLVGARVGPAGGTPAWIGVPGGGGGARILEAASLARRAGTGETEVLVAGSRPEVAFAASLLREAGVRYRLLEVGEESTFGCVRALAAATSGSGRGVLVTHEGHAVRLRLAWALIAPLRVPAVRGLPGGPAASGEALKVAWYLVRY